MEELTSRKRMPILINIVLMTFMATLQGSIVNVALPGMADGLAVSGEAIAWVVTAFLITVTVTILVFGKIGDAIGKTKVFMAGVALFTVGSLLCGIANSLPLLVIARVVQGIGASAAFATNQGIIAETFPRTERGRALGISGSFVALGQLVGPPLGGFFVSFVSWNYIFLINVPIGIFVYIMGTRNLPKEAVKPEALALNSAEAPGDAAVVPGGGAPAGISAGVSTGVSSSGDASNPPNPPESRSAILRVLSQFGIFKNGVFTLSILCALISFIALSSSMIIQPFYLQDVMQYSPALTGFIMVVNPLILLFVAPASGHLSDRIGSEFLTFLGLAITSVGLLLMSTLTEHSGMIALILFLAVMSLGSGMFQSPNTSLIMSSVTPDKLGIAGSLNAFMRNLGMVIGTALATTLLYGLMSQRLGYRVSDFVKGREDVFIYGMKYVYIVAAVICAVGALLTAFRLYSKRKSRGERLPNTP